MRCGSVAAPRDLRHIALHDAYKAGCGETTTREIPSRELMLFSGNARLPQRRGGSVERQPIQHSMIRGNHMGLHPGLGNKSPGTFSKQPSMYTSVEYIVSNTNLAAQPAPLSLGTASIPAIMGLVAPNRQHPICRSCKRFERHRCN
jgi:hypothetical protein